MLKKITLSVFLIFQFLSSFSQKEAQIWYFGQHAGLDFSTKPPTAITNGQINTREGVSSICNKNGQLLFYSEGTKVWDRTHAIMPNGSGLQGDYSSTQSSIAVPNPGNAQRYFLFTTAYLLGTRYSEIDMGLNGGRGDVIPATKNSLLIANSESSEKLIATRHCNRTDYWVITHKVNSTAYYVYLVNATGVQPPLVFNIGSYIGSSAFWQGTAYLKFSPDGSRLVNVMGNSNASNIDGNIDILNFDNKTGIISAPVINLPGFNQPYGAEFSSDNRYLYISSLGDRSLLQYDLTAANVNASRFTIATGSLSYGALQMGIDGKIYVAVENGYNVGYDYLGVINNPGLGGVASNYLTNGISLAGRRTLIGLPTYISDFLKDTSGIAFQNNCAQNATRFSTLYNGNIDSVSWDFGDGTAALTQLNPIHTYSSAGTYNVRSIVYRSCSANDTVNKQVTIRAGYLNTTNVPVCSATEYILPNGNIVNASGDYPVSYVSADGCDSVVTFRVSFLSAPNLNLGNDTTLCITPNITLDAGTGFSAYTWQDGSTSQRYPVNSPGVYWAEVTASNGCKKRDSIVVTKSSTTGFSLGPDKTICEGASHVMGQTFTGATSYLWNTGATTAQITAAAAGEYWLEMQEGVCVKRDTVTLFADTSPGLTLGNDTTLCSTPGYLLNAGTGFSDYVWQDGSTASNYVVDATGLYWAEVTAINGCKKRDSIIVIKSGVADFSLGADKAICGTMPINIGQNVPGASYLWNTGAVTAQIAVINAGEYWLEVRENGCINRDTISLVSSPAPTIVAQKSNDIDCSTPLAQLNATGANNYQWTPSTGLSNPGIANPRVAITNSTTYVVRGTTVDGCIGYDSIKISVVATQGKETYSMPNAFTPNADGKNDCFGVRKWGALEEMELSIFNRWGQRIFFSKDISACWDGTVNGKKQDAGGYVYIIRAKSFCGEVFRKGLVMLVR